MADTTPVEEKGPEIVSAFPLPPAFFTLYKEGVGCGPSPPEPMQPTYHMFGTPFSTMDAVPDLLPQPGQKLYLPDDSSVNPALDCVSTDANVGNVVMSDSDSTPLIDYKMQMKKINHSLLVNFMGLIDVLIKKPSLFNEKLNDLELLFLNMHNLINSFRPHQARETIIHLLKTQIQDRRYAAQEIRRTIDEARRNVEEKHSQLQEIHEDGHQPIDSDVKVESFDNMGEKDLELYLIPNGSTNHSKSLHDTTRCESLHKAHGVEQMQESFFTTLSSAMIS